MDRYYFFTDFKTLKALMDDKFSVLEEFRKEAQEAQRPLTLSIGISFGEENIAKLDKWLLKTLILRLFEEGIRLSFVKMRITPILFTLVAVLYQRLNALGHVPGR